MNEKLEEIKKAIDALPLVFQIFGLLVFAWMSWRTIPAILFVLQAFTVLAVLILLGCCLFLNEEQTENINKIAQAFRSLANGEEKKNAR